MGNTTYFVRTPCRQLNLNVYVLMLQIYLYLSLNMPAVVLAHRRRNTCILITEFSVELIRKNWLFFKPVYCALPYCWECSYVNKCCRINYKEMAQLVEECREEIITHSGYCEWEVSKCSAFCYSELTYCTGSGTHVALACPSAALQN